MDSSILAQLSTIFTIDNFVFLLIGITGMAAHAVKKFYRGQMDINIIDYYFKNNTRMSLLALATALGALGAIVLGDQAPDKIGAWIALAFTTGYMADSSVNKD